jgi:hypothetical protein
MRRSDPLNSILQIPDGVGLIRLRWHDTALRSLTSGGSRPAFACHRCKSSMGPLKRFAVPG